jgi:hypothetical protein
MIYRHETRDKAALVVLSQLEVVALAVASRRRRGRCRIRSRAWSGAPRGSGHRRSREPGEAKRRYEELAALVEIAARLSGRQPIVNCLIGRARVGQELRP